KKRFASFICTPFGAGQPASDSSPPGATPTRTNLAERNSDEVWPKLQQGQTELASGEEALFLANGRCWSGGGGGNRTRVREPSAVRPTCLARPFESRLATAGRRAVAWPAASTDPPGQAARPGGEADVNDAAPGFRPA